MAINPHYPMDVTLAQNKGFKTYLRNRIALYKLRRQVALERKQLAELPDEILKDIGIRLEDVLLESARDLRDIPPERIANLR